MALTPKQARFVEEYLVDMNGAAAYRRAGYTARGNAAEVNASRLLRNAKVAAAVQKAVEARSERTAVTADAVLQGLQEEATYRGEGASHSARVAAWSWLGRHLKLFTEQVEAKVDLNVDLDDARERLAGRIAQLATRSGTGPGAGGADG